MVLLTMFKLTSNSLSYEVKASCLGRLLGQRPMFPRLLGLLCLVCGCSGGWEGIPPAVTTPESIKRLDPATTELRVIGATDAILRELNRFPKLDYLLVTQNNAATGVLSSQGFSHVAACPELRQLIIANCPNLDDNGLRELATSPSIEWLSVKNCKHITGEGIASLAGLSSLRVFSLGQLLSSQDFEGVTTLAQLTDLNISLLADEDYAIEQLARLNRLETITVYVRGENAEEYSRVLSRQLQVMLPNCRVTVSAKP